MPSPAFTGLTEAADVHETTKLMFARLDQRVSARRAAPMTSLSGLMLEPGIISDVEKETSIVFLGQRIRRLVWAVGSTSEESRISSRPPGLAPRSEEPRVGKECRARR